MKNNLKFFIIGSQGQLGKEFQTILSRRNLSFVAPAEADCNITDKGQIARLIEDAHPDVVVNCAAYNNVEIAEEERETAFKVNADSVADLAATCRRQGIFLIHFSSDYIFDGTKGDYYQEDDKTNPLNVYGASKLKGEENIRRIMPNGALIFRLSWVFGLGQQNFLYKLSTWIKTSKSLKISDDEISVPTYTEDVVDVVLLALAKGLKGLYHLTNTNKCSRYEWAKYYLEKEGVPVEVIPVPMSNFPSKINRPLFSAMSNKKLAKELGIELPTWQNAVDRFIKRTDNN
jgi:dTDP-4-dehydrorhamnose reductase